MFKNYLKIAFRNIKLNKTYSLINIVGLAVGLAACFIMFLYVAYQLSYDKYNKKLDDIYLVYEQDKFFNFSQPSSPAILAPTLKEEIPGLENFARFTNRVPVTISYRDKTFEEKRCVCSDFNIFNILTLPLKFGNQSSFINTDNSIIINESMAEKYFGNENPIGKVLTVTSLKKNYDLTIKAVMKDIPGTSTFAADFIAPLNIAEDYLQRAFLSYATVKESPWNLSFIKTYILLSPKANKEIFDKKLVGFCKQHLTSPYVQYKLFPLKDVYFYSSFMVNNRSPQGSISNVYIYSSAAFLILLISVITFLMLNIGRASLRTKEIGIRKVIGALKRDLFKQIMVESLVVSLIALPLAVLLVQIVLPSFTEFIGLKISTDYFHSWSYFFVFILISLTVGTISGLYVALYLFKWRPAEILQNKFAGGSNRKFFRRVMVGTPIIIFSGLIFSAVTVYKQLQYFHNKDFGFNKEQLVFFYPDDYRSFKNNYNAFKNLLKSNPSVINLSAGTLLPGNNSSMVYNCRVPNTPGKEIKVEGLSVNDDFIETLQIPMLAGKTFHQNGTTDSSKVCIINEAAMKELNLTDPIGQKLNGETIIGVTKDFIVHSFHRKLEPIVIGYTSKYLEEIVVRIRHGNMLNTINFLREKSKQFNNDKPMEFQFWDERLNDLYGDETRFAEVFGTFTGLAIFVACLGLFGMSLFVIQNRIKEIGIRKVMGASINNIFVLTTREFLVTALVSAIIAFPISSYLINGWLQNFAYRISFDGWMYFIASLLVLAIVLITVSIQAIKAALANPVKSLRYE